MTVGKFLLASASPRRRELLRLLNFPFESTNSDIDETPLNGESASSLVSRLSRLKARAASQRFPECIVIAADTDGELDNTILGKPRDTNEARAMLHALRGRDHIVHGGITVSAPPPPDSVDEMRRETTLVTLTRVWMREYTDAEVEAYVATGDPLDKAAGYAVQHRSFRPVDRVEGCYCNIMGMALCKLELVLAQDFSIPEPCLECHLHPAVDCTIPRLIEEGRIVNS